jgi:HEAT repeat protein
MLVFLGMEPGMKTKRDWATVPSKLCLKGILSILGVAGSSAFAQAPAPEPATAALKEQPGNTALPSLQATAEKAWGILREGLKEESAEKRAKAVRALGLLTGNAEAEKAAVSALQDKKPNVRAAAATALGSMQAQHANLELEGVLQDSEPAVVLAAANSLLLLHDNVGYDIYYDVLTGERRASKGLIKEQFSTFKDKKKLAELGFEQGIGFIPFAGMGYEAFKTVRKDDSSPVRAAAAKQLARDPSPGTGKALVKATTDKNWAVRAAALEAISQRGDRSLISEIATALDDAKDEVRFAAAACVAHLSEIPPEKTSAGPAKP